MPPILIVLIIMAVLALGAVAWRQEVKRRQAVRAWVLRRHWHLAPDKRRGWDREYPGIKLFGRGHSRSGRGVIKGAWHERPVTLLDYTYVTGSGKNRQTHKYGVVILHCDFPTIPLQLRRENPLDKIGEFVGLDDIDFESAEFSRKFYVKSSDRKWAYDVIHPRTMEFLLQSPSFELEFGMAELAVYKRGWFAPDAYEQALDLAWGIYDRIPDYVVRSMKGS